MSGVFNKVLCKDDRIGCITDAVNYGVYKGAQNVTSYTYNAISHSTSSHVLNIAIPSLETVISREVLWRSTVTLKITGSANKPDHLPCVNYGVTDALSPFPLHSLVATMTATINNNTVATNMSDVLPALLRLMDPEELAYYNDMTPTTLDYLSDYADGGHAMPYVIGRAGDANSSRLAILMPGANFDVPRTPITGGIGDAATVPALTESIRAGLQGTAPTKYLSYPNNILGFDYNRPSGTGKKHRPRGS
jgi:hypothetical protein